MTENGNCVIAIDGATGYVGSHLVHALSCRGVTLHAIVHPGANEADCAFLESCGAKIFKTNLDANSPVLLEALNAAQSVVHLIGSIAPPKGQKLADLHAGQSKELIAAVKQQPKTKVIMITALGTAKDADSEYHRSKWQAEELLRQSGLQYLIMRPSLILGRQVGRRDSKLMSRYLKLIDERPRVPVLAGGKNLLQPVFIGDLATAIANAALDENLSGKTLEIGGAEVLSMKDLLEKLMSTIGKHKPLQAIPAQIASIAASFLEMVQTVPLLSRDQVKLSLKDNVCKDNAIESILGKSPLALTEALETYKSVRLKAGVQ